MSLSTLQLSLRKQVYVVVGLWFLINPDGLKNIWRKIFVFRLVNKSQIIEANRAV